MWSLTESTIHFYPERVNPQSVAARDVDKCYIEMILAHRGRSTNKRSYEFKVRWVSYDESDDSWEL